MKPGDEIRVTLVAKVTSVDDKGNVFVQPIGHDYRFMLNGDAAVVQTQKARERGKDPANWQQLDGLGTYND